MPHLSVSTDTGVATVVIDHPPINLMTIEVFLDLADVTRRLAEDDDVRVVVLRSAHPEWFIAHFDVAAILGFPTDPAPPSADLNTFHVMCEHLRTMPKATIAVIEGRVGGGGSELALSCDLRFAAPAAVFSQPEVALGIIPGGSGTVRLPRLVGRSRALEVILGCDDVDAATAERWGWVNRVLGRRTSCGRSSIAWPAASPRSRRMPSPPPRPACCAPKPGSPSTCWPRATPSPPRSVTRRRGRRCSASSTMAVRRRRSNGASASCSRRDPIGPLERRAPLLRGPGRRGGR